MIVKDETVELDRCLNCAKGLYNELIVAWNGTNPKTKEILIKHNAKIIPYKWRDDFAHARNCSIKPATGKWVLWLDADEQLQKDDISYIKTYIKDCEYPIINFNTCIVNPNKSTTHKVPRGRLFKNGLDIKFKNMVHENICITGTFNSPVLDVNILHERDDNDALFNEKVLRYQKILEKAVKADPNSSFLIQYLIESYVSQRMYKEAIKTFIKLKRRLKPNLYAAQILTNIAKCYYCLLKTPLAIEHANRALLICRLPVTYNLLASIFIKQRKIKAAIRMLEKAKSIRTPQFNLMRLSEIELQIGSRIPLSKLYFFTGKTDKAIENLKEVLALDENNVEAKLLIEKFRQDTQG